MLWDPLELWPKWRTPLWVLLAILALVTQGPIFVSGLRPVEGVGVDLFQDWASARNFLDGLPIYTPHSVTIPRYLGYTAIPIDRQTVWK